MVPRPAGRRIAPADRARLVPGPLTHAAPRPGGRRAAPAMLVLAAAAVLAAAGAMLEARTARAAADPPSLARAATARPVAPAPGARGPATGLRFAWTLPAAAREPVLLLSRHAFDPAGWSEVPALDGLTALRDPRPGLALAESGFAVDAETPFWWAVATRDAATGALRVSEVRRATALRPFANRVATTPLLREARRGPLPRPARPGALAAGDGVRPPGAPAAAAPPGGPPPPPRPRIRLAAGYDFAPAEGLPALPPELTLARRPRAESGGALEAVLVQFPEPPGEAERAAIAAAGGAVVAYLPDQAYLVRADPAARAALERAAPGAWIGAWEPAYRLSPRCERAAPGAGDFDALLFPDADPARARAALAALGAEVAALTDNGVNRIARFRLDRARLADAAALDAVAWVEPVARFEADNQYVQWIVQTATGDSRRVWDQGLRGQGQVLMTSDSGVNTGHDQFRDPAVPLDDFGDYPSHRKLVAYRNGSLNPAVQFGDHGSFHGTHTGGTLLGSDDGLAGSLRDGVAKEARLFFMDLSGAALGTGVDPFPDLNDLFQPSYDGNAAGAARIASNSWGAPVRGAYTLHAMAVDQFIWNHPDYFIAFSNGNNSVAGSVGAPATAKNSAGVGGTGNNASLNFLYTATSRGPTADGRRKPTFCAPGQGVFSSTGGTATYQSYSGTSMAAPSAAGAIALMRQYLVDGWYPTGAPVAGHGFSPSAALLKAMAVNSAENAINGYTAPDFNVGWGRVLADNVLYFPGDARRLMLVDHAAGLGHGQFVEYQVQVVDGAVPLEVTLCWSDFPGSPAAAVQLVNDLDLVVTNGVATYLGNVYAAGSSVTGGARDTLNVEENVRVAAPSPGLWTVRVAAPRVPMGPQPFALCVTGGVGLGAAALALDRVEYGPDDGLAIQVLDADAVAPVTVTVASSTEGAETVALAGGDGVWTATLPLTLAPPAAADGALSVSNGDAIAATYADATTGAALAAEARVDFDTPLISDVRATPLGLAGTLVTWTTDRNSTSRVHVGLTPALELGAVDSSGYALEHRVLVRGVVPGQTYQYDVESKSLSGATARDDLGGAHRRFTATGGGDLLLVMDDAWFPNRGTWETSLAALGYSFDTWDGALAADPPVGDLDGGLRAYQAVLWQVGRESYPPFGAAQRAALDSLLGGGGRLLTVGHDIGWGLATTSAPGWTPEGAAWLEGTLRTRYLEDPATWTTQRGIAGDPVSGAFTSAVDYLPFGTSQAGDGVRTVPGAPGTSAGIWLNNDLSPGGNDTTAIRWESPGPLGAAAAARWGGQSSRLVNLCFEWSQLSPPASAPDAERDAILGATLAWLLGRTPPAVTVTAPNGGETIESNTLTIAWTESAAPGFAVASRSIEYSLDGGDSWTLVTDAPGPGPYAWDVTGVPNSGLVRVRVRVVDDGTPPLSGADESDASAELARLTADGKGPVIVAGSIRVSPNPLVRPGPAAVLARASEVLTGGGLVAAAEWSVGDTPAPAGTGGPLASTFDSVAVDVSGALDLTAVAPGTRTVWVRARDAAGNWGPAAGLEVVVNGADPVSVGPAPAATFLAPAAPNPFTAGVALRFGLAHGGLVALDVYDVQGRRVRRLLAGALPAGAHAATWDGRDEAGRCAPPGVYLARLAHPGGTLERRLVAIE